MQVYIIVPSLHAHLSPSIYGAVLELVAHLGTLRFKSESASSETLHPHSVTSNEWRDPIFGLSISANLELVFLEIDLANNGDNSSALMLALKDLDLWYVDFVFLITCLFTSIGVLLKPQCYSLSFLFFFVFELIIETCSVMVRGISFLGMNDVFLEAFL